MSGGLAPSELRREILAQRRAQPPAEAKRLGELISRKIIAALEVPPFQSLLNTLQVGFFRPLPEEPALAVLESWLHSRGARLYYPRVIDRAAQAMELACVTPDQAWSSGPFGIEEPHSSAEIVDPARLDLLFVPGVVFGMQGERIGMGAGFYDRYLPRASKALRVVAAFDFQLHPWLEQKPWDQPVDWIFTESREARTQRLEDWLKANRLEAR